MRELRNVVERAAILTDDLIESSDLPMLKLADANRLNMYQGHGHHGRPAKPEE